MEAKERGRKLQIDDFQMMVVLAQESNMRKSGGTFICFPTCAESTITIYGETMGNEVFYSLTKRIDNYT